MREEQKKIQEEVTRAGNPRKPQGQEGEQMLERMNESHYEVTGWALNHIDFAQDDEVLDIGCGGGATLRRISPKIETGHLWGVDYSAVSVAKTAELNKDDVASGKLRVIEASVDNLPFEDNTFDKIVTVESFYFWPSPAENLREVRRVLKEDGVFLLVADIYKKDGLSKDILENVERYNLFNPDQDEYREMFKAAGFKNVDIHTVDGKDWICVEGRK